MKRLLLCFLMALPHLLQAQGFVPMPFPVEGGLPLEGVYLSSIAFADVDGDDDQDLMITGEIDGRGRVATLYTNITEDGTIRFAEMIDAPFKGVSGSSISFADIDGDSDLDLLTTGLSNSSVRTVTFYTNDGEGGFTEISDTTFEGVAESSVAFADVDKDNDLDLFITGRSYSRRIAKLYTNDGEGGFTEITGTPFEGVYLSSIAFADVDKDDDPDFLITGLNSSDEPIAKLYFNDGNGGFTEVTGTPLEGVFGSSVTFADVDLDGDLDLLIAGRNRLDDARYQITKLYANDGKGGLTEITGTPFETVAYSSIALADIDGDNDPDLVITGEHREPGDRDLISRLYTNDTEDGTVRFTEVIDTPLEGVGGSSIDLADIDGDNDQDLVITGMNISDKPKATLYINTLNTPTSVELPSNSQAYLPQFFPNPVVNASVALSYSANKFGELSISVSDAAGKTLVRHQATVSEGENTIPLNCADLSKGTYLVELKQGDHSTSMKLVIQ